MSSAVPAIKLALKQLLYDLYTADGARIIYGPPQGEADKMACIIGASARHERPTAGGAYRSREEEADVQVVLSVAVPGDVESFDDAAQMACEGVYEMFDRLEDHFRNRHAATLGGACRDAIVSSHELSEYASEDADGYITGRVAEITATITCRTRI